MSDMDTQSIKRLPFGISDFRDVREKGRYYVDKTMYIPKLELSADFLFVARPRRFGKSMFLTMMRDYYDIKMADRFEEEFSGTWIAAHPTPLQGKFQVLYFDFSQVGTSHGRTWEEKFNDYCNRVEDRFIRYYADFYDPATVKRLLSVKGHGAKLQEITSEAKLRGYRQYLIIDEYDNFTNTILSGGGKEDYRTITKKDGFYREVFKNYKPNFPYIMMMGVSPVTLYDLTSGYNIATNISFKEKYNQMLGFSEDDIREMIRYYRDAGQIEMGEDEIIGQIRPWYDNYCFSEVSFENGEPGMYNSNMVLYYLNTLIDSGRPPKSLADPNSRSDFSKLRMLVNIDEESKKEDSIILQAATSGFIDAPLAEEISIDNMQDAAFLPSMLTYQGALTIGGTVGKYTHLVIPNNNAREQFYSFMTEMFRSMLPKDTKKEKDLSLSAVNEGKWTELLSFAIHSYYESATAKTGSGGEALVQGYLLGFFHASQFFDVQIEADANEGYCNILITPNPKRGNGKEHSCVVELKYLGAKESDASAAMKWDSGVEQVRRYASSPRIMELTKGTILDKVVMSVRVRKLERVEKII